MSSYRMAGDRPGTWQSALTPGMITATRTLGSPRPSSDGAWVAYTLSYDGRTDLYVVASGGGLSRQLTTDKPVSGGNFCWTPDGAAIVYTSGGKLWRVPSGGGVARQLSEGEGAHVFPRLSPDGGAVLIVADRDEDMDIGLVPVSLENGDDRQWPLRVSHGTDFTLDPQWAPDGSWAVWMAYDNRRMPWDESYIARALVPAIASARLDGPRLEKTRILAKRAGHAYAQPRVSPDGRRIAFLCDATGWLNVWIMEADGQAAVALVPEEHEHGGPAWPFDMNDLAWSPDGRTIAHTRNVDGRIGIALLDPRSGKRTLLTDLPGVHEQIAWCGPDADALVCTFSAPDTPPQIVRIAVPGGERTILAQGAPAGVREAWPVLPEHVTYTATDGRAAHALLYTPRRPASDEGYPLLVYFHGGPTAQCTEEWQAALQYFVARGWAVLQPNFRGSTGYGKAYKDALNGMWGEGELRDGLGGVDYLVEGGGIDRTRVVAWGGSNGGYDTLYCLSKAPGRFAAGVCLYGISDVALLSEDTHRFERYYADTLVGPLPEAWRRCRELSPLDYVDQVRDPLLILHGGKDTDVPINQAELFVERLKRAGKEHEYHVYPEEGHGWRRVATTMDYLQRMDAFLMRYVLMRQRP